MSGNQMGDITKKNMSNSLARIKSTLDNNTVVSKSMNTKMNSLKEINKKLSDSYSISLKIIVDVSKLLNQYMIYFNEIEKMMNDLDKRTSNSFNNDYFSHINNMTSQKIDELTNEFKQQLNNLKPTFEKNNIPIEELNTYEQLLSDINLESKLITQRKSGGKKKRQ